MDTWPHPPGTYLHVARKFGGIGAPGGVPFDVLYEGRVTHHEMYEVVQNNEVQEHLDPLVFHYVRIEGVIHNPLDYALDQRYPGLYPVDTWLGTIQPVLDWQIVYASPLEMDIDNFNPDTEENTP